MVDGDMTIDGITLRQTKGSPLTFAEVDANFTRIKQSFETYTAQFENGTRRTVVFSVSQPDDKGVVWAKITATNTFAGLFWHNGTAWVEMYQRGGWFAVDGSTVASTVALTIDGFSSLVTGQTVVWTNLLANTGAATLTINAGASIALVDEGGSALVAGELPAGWTAIALYNGTHLRLLNPAVVNLPSVHKIAVSSELTVPAQGVALNWTHGLGAQATRAMAHFVCKTAGSGYTVGQRIPYFAVLNGNSNDETPAFQLTESTDKLTLTQWNYGPSLRRVLNPTDGSGVTNLDLSQWKVVFTAELVQA